MNLRVDARLLRDEDVHRILEGEGFPDLGIPSLARRHPRDHMDEVSLEDLSMTGLGLEGDADFVPGAAFTLDMHLPGDPVVVKALAEVMWVQGQGERKRAGLRFAAINWMELQRLRRLLVNDRRN